MDIAFYDQEYSDSHSNIALPARGTVISSDTLEVKLNANTLPDIHRYQPNQLFRKIGHQRIQSFLEINRRELAYTYCQRVNGNISALVTRAFTGCDLFE